MKQLKEKVAIVTGAGQGIGKGIALCLAKRGVKVIATGRRAEPIEQTIAEIKELGGEVIKIAAGSHDHINAMDMNEGYGDSKDPLSDKSEFIMSLFEQLDKNGVDSIEHSLIDRCVREVYDEAYAKAVELQKKEGYTFIHPFDDEDIIEGQGTIALEILEELPDTDVILVPIGGGGLIAGIACAAKQINPNVKIYGVEPEGAASALAAIHEDQVVTLAEANTIADGTAVKTIGSKTFEYIKKYVDGIITVNDYELMDAFLLLVEKHKLVAEGSGILSLAGLKKLYEKNKKVVSLVSGGNIDVLTISSMINKGLISRGRIFTFSVQLPDKPGQLELVSKVLNQCNANVIAVDHNQFKNFARFSEVELRVTVETNGNSHIQTIIDEFAKLGYNIIKIN